MEQRSFDISIIGGDRLITNQIWPDGDGPSEPTAEDVAKVIADSGGLRRWLSEWSMDSTVVVCVDGVQVMF